MLLYKIYWALSSTHQTLNVHDTHPLGSSHCNLLWIPSNITNIPSWFRLRTWITKVLPFKGKNKKSSTYEYKSDFLLMNRAKAFSQRCIDRYSLSQWRPKTSITRRRPRWNLTTDTETSSKVLRPTLEIWNSIPWLRVEIHNLKIFLKLLSKILSSFLSWIFWISGILPPVLIASCLQIQQTKKSLNYRSFTKPFIWDIHSLKTTGCNRDL